MSRKAESMLAIVVAVTLLAAMQLLWPEPGSESTGPLSDPQSVAEASTVTADRGLDTLTMPLTEYDPLAHTGPTLEFPNHIEQLLDDKAYRQARAALMQSAEDAVSSGDRQALADSLTLLGMAALAEPDLDAAELFFLEALDIFEVTNNAAGAARVYMQIGHLHVISRERARRAANAYDQLLVARWKISNGHYYEAQSQLQDIIDSNITLARFGAAASASESLVRAWQGAGDSWQAQQAALQAIRLYAASGQRRVAERLINELRGNNANAVDAGIDYEAIQTEVDGLLTQFESSVTQIERARDYQQLYNHYRAKGDDRRAWKFRLLASQSLAGASKRAMYHRQPDVLVALYGSNRSMELANRSLREAHSYFQSTGSKTGLDAVQQLQAKIY